MRKPVSIKAFVIRVTIAVLLLAAGALGQWDPERRVTTGSDHEFTTAGNARAVAMVGDVVHVVYYRGALLASTFYRRSTDRGATWQAEVQLSTSIYGSFPAIAVNGDIVHVVWFEFSGSSYVINYKRSTDAGVSWGATTTISGAGTYHEVPSIAVSGNSVHVAWDDGAQTLYYRRSTNAGGSWLSVQTLRASNAATASVAADGNTVLVSYSVGSGSAWDIYLRRSTDGGASFLSEVLVTDAGTLADISSLSVRGSNCNVVWYDNGSGNYDVRGRRSTDGGATWQSPVTIAGGTSSQEAPCIVASPSNVLHVVYEDNGVENYEIWHKYSTDNGATWSTATRLSQGANVSQRPTICLDGTNTLGVAWCDERNGNYDIYFRRGIVSPSPSPDIQAVSIDAPTGTVLWNTSHQPKAKFKNNSATEQTFDVCFRIGTWISGPKTMTLGPGATDQMTFDWWTASTPGTFQTKCSAYVAGDINRANDTLIRSVFVSYLDAQPVSILSPSGTVNQGQSVPVQVRVRNNSNIMQSIPCRFRIPSTGYDVTRTADEVPAGEEQTITFPNWTAAGSGNVAMQCSTELIGDMVPDNDKLPGTVFVQVLDAQPTIIVSPSGTVNQG
ncbi:MAG: sialidase family protein, partial [candidate division WOR-3 bacterium]